MKLFGRDSKRDAGETPGEGRHAASVPTPGQEHRLQDPQPDLRQGGRHAGADVAPGADGFGPALRQPDGQPGQADPRLQPQPQPGVPGPQASGAGMPPAAPGTQAPVTTAPPAGPGMQAPGGGMQAAGAGWHEPTGPLAVQAAGVTKVYGSGDNQVHALAGIDVGFERGRFTAIMGPSGSGKSTLMHCLAGLDTVTSGHIRIGDTELSGLSDKGLTALRRDKLGFVFQSFNLVPTLNAKENITLPLDIAGRKVDPEWMGRVVDILKLRDRLNHRPSELSGGQQQRVACARAIVGRPEVIFGDEPTGNLDSRTSGEVLAILRESVDNLGQTVVIVTHDPRAAAWADRVVFLADGRLAGQMMNPTADAVLDAMKNMEG